MDCHSVLYFKTQPTDWSFGKNQPPDDDRKSTILSLHLNCILGKSVKGQPPLACLMVSFAGLAPQYYTETNGTGNSAVKRMKYSGSPWRLPSAPPVLTKI
jgi:hypothetical protein